MKCGDKCYPLQAACYVAVAPEGRIQCNYNLCAAESAQCSAASQIKVARYPQVPLTTNPLMANGSDCRPHVAELKARACQGVPSGRPLQFFWADHDAKGDFFNQYGDSIEMCP
jgi:hypothetical protein